MTPTSFSNDTFKFKTNLKKKIIATMFDYSLVLIPTFMYIMYFGHDNSEGGKTVDGLMALPIPMLWFLYFVVVEAMYGATFAHQALYLKVTTLDRKEIELIQALKRHLLDPIDILFWGIPGIIAIKNTDKHQRLGDMWAKTIVVDTKDPEQH
ncbi:RDD family protein [Limnovirga soli]|uniref:RDD family protein n=1 Tax=Limnovirga soli TaxID=2656915 RepID=A0A8J8FDS2_9BACT|nr:RDD family protein [Limnovirga soli]NNV56190.1 RDD family protein [Limnovirga soli]